MASKQASPHHLPRAALAKVPRQQRSIAMVHSIVDAAKRVLEREGLEAFTTNRVADVAGVSVGSLYQYFPNKDALLLGVMERGLHMAEDVCHQALAASQATTFEEAYRELMTGLIEHLEPRRPLLREVLAGTPLLSETGFVSVVESMVRDLIGELRVRASLPPLAPDASYVAVNAMAFVFLKWMTETPAHVSREALLTQLARMITAMGT